MAKPNNDDGANDKGGFAPHKNRCIHANNAIDIPFDITHKLQSISMNNGNDGEVTCSIDGCNETECWLCLKCHKILCGRYGNQHMMLHCIETNTEHCMAMGIKDLSFWCYKCENYINHLSVKRVWDFYSVAHIARFNEPIPEGLYQKTTFKKEVRTTFTMAAIEEDEDGDIDDEKKNASFADEKKYENESASNNKKPKPNLRNEAIDIIDEILSKFTLDVDGGYKRTVLIYHEDCLKHKPRGSGSHVERPGRCSRPYEMLRDYGLLEDLIEIEAREATMKELKGTHSNNHVEIIIGNEGQAGWYDGDTFYCPDSARAAKLAAGATIDLMKTILENEYDNGFALVRPPGHHCEHNKRMFDSLSLFMLSIDSVIYLQFAVCVRCQ